MKRLTIFLLCLSLKTLGATYVVTSNADAGANTLRDAITQANANAGADIIQFNFGVPTVITLASCLPDITGPVTINGYSEPSSGLGAPAITLNANGACLNGLTLNAGSGGSTIQGLVIYGSNRGLYLINSGSHFILANFIGTNTAGTAVAPNVIAWNGIEMDQSSNNTIGGGGLAARNIISGANEMGIRLQGSSSNNLISGNFIGTDKAGTAAIPNGQNGIFFLGNSGNNTVDGNIISGNNQRGILSDNCTGLIIQNNFIGTDIFGNNALGNLTRGMEIVANSHNPSILNNVICSNGQHGISLNNCLRPIIQGNKIGVGSTGTSVLGNGEHGIEVINCLRPTIGGTAASHKNYICNNTLFGIQAVLCDSIRIKGNSIGLDLGGVTDRGNGVHGINIAECRNPTIGGTTSDERNYVSGNNAHGISINGAVSDRAIVKGNVIGLGTDLNTAIGNGAFGLEVTDCENSQVGGLTVTERNYVSNNSSNGIMIVRSDNTVIEGNYVGTDGTGLIARGNLTVGIRVESSANVTVGGTSFAARNICSGNLQNGIVVDGTSTGCKIKANFAGLGADGSTTVGNGFTGIYLLGASTGTIVGGSTYAERNVSSGNGALTGTGDGIRVEGPDNNIILGNFCGVDSTGTLARPNFWGGISLNESSGNTVGGTGIYDGNICSANGNEGMYLRNAVNNLIIGNYIGTDRTGTLQLGNEDWGINISPAGGGSSDNIIGGSAAQRNIIAYNRNVPGYIDGGPGVYVNNHSHRNTITYNNIFCNQQRGIERNGAGNENVAAPVTTASLTNDISGTGTAGHTIHIYRNTTADGAGWCDCEGEIFIGTTVVDGSGNWTYTHNLGLSIADAASVSATQTNATGSTSAFSNCSAPLPVVYLSFTARRVDAQSAILNWTTASEMNNDHFVILRSTDGITFEAIGTVNGHGNSTTPSSYSFTDHQVPDAQVVYYRLKQVDTDGKSTQSIIRSITGSGELYAVSLRDNKLSLGILMEGTTATIRVISMTGQVILEHTVKGSGWIEEDIFVNGISKGAYIIQIQQETSLSSVKAVN